MVDVQFGNRGSAKSIAFTVPEDLDTIFIPTEALNNVSRALESAYDLTPHEAKKAAEVYLEEVYPQTLGHEATHLALGHLAKKERLPVLLVMTGWHTSIPREFERQRKEKALNKALSKALDVALNMSDT